MASRAARAGLPLLPRVFAASGASGAFSGPALAASVPSAAAAAAATQLPRQAGSLLPLAARMGSGGPGVTYAGLTLHKPTGWQKWTGHGLAALMWFWVFVRVYHDGDVLIWGPEVHFKHEDKH